MTALEAIPKVTELLASLIKRVKDHETFTTVQQIQEYQLVIQRELLAAQTENLELKRKMFEMEQSHAKTVSERDSQIAKLQEEDSPGFSGILTVPLQRPPSSL